jgi:hypothetical protein
MTDAALVLGDPMTFRCVWVIADLDMTMGELRAQATAELPDRLFEMQVQPAGEPSWRVVEVAEGPSGSWLVLDLPVLAWHDPARDRQRRATTPTRG